MKGLLTLFVLAFTLVAGCSARKEAAMEHAAAVEVNGAEVQSTGGGGGLAPISPALGGSSPVVGSETIQGGGGSAVGQMAKDRARSIAADAGTTNQEVDSAGE